MTKKKQEDSGPIRGQLDTVRRAEYLINSSALSYYLTHEFYDVLLANASMHEQIGEESASSGYGFAMFIYNAGKRDKCFDCIASGLGGFGVMISNAIRWINEEISEHGKNPDFSSRIIEVGNPRLVNNELDDDPIILRNLVLFAQAWESASEILLKEEQWLNMYFEFFPNSTDMPKELDWGAIEFKGCNYYPQDTLGMFTEEIEKMKAAIEDGPDPICPEPPEDFDDED